MYIVSVFPTIWPIFVNEQTVRNLFIGHSFIIQNYKVKTFVTVKFVYRNVATGEFHTWMVLLQLKKGNIEPNDHMTESRAWNAVLRAEICWKCFRNNSTTDCNSFRLKRFPDLRVKNFNQEQAEGGGNLSIKRLESRSVSCLSHNELRNGGEWVWRFRGL